MLRKHVPDDCEYGCGYNMRYKTLLIDFFGGSQASGQFTGYEREFIGMPSKCYARQDQLVMTFFEICFGGKLNRRFLIGDRLHGSYHRTEGIYCRKPPHT